ncbi:hypothetical protein M431DRAFT_102478, partial [Trichoderma harzianum CBS 226.95]
KLILFNLITKLPSLKKLIIKWTVIVLYNNIFIIVNRFIKIVYFILFKEVSNIKKLAYVIIKYIISNYKLLGDIIFNKGNIFIFKF